jgi:hypothetical protein
VLSYEVNMYKRGKSEHPGRWAELRVDTETISTTASLKEEE